MKLWQVIFLLLLIVAMAIGCGALGYLIGHSRGYNQCKEEGIMGWKTEYLLPSGPGFYKEILDDHCTGDSPIHWELMDDPPGSPDNDGCYAFGTSSCGKDSYQMQNLVTDKVISDITVTWFASVRHNHGDPGFCCLESYIKPFCRLNAVDSLGNQIVVDQEDVWQLVSQQIYKPGGGEWNKDDIADLELGFWMCSVNNNCCLIHIRQLYMKIDYYEHEGISEFYLLPNGVGDYENLNPGGGGNYLLVDDPVGNPDDGGSYVYAYTSQLKDAYQLEDTELENIIIEKVEVYFRIAGQTPAFTGYGQPFLRLNSQETQGTERSWSSGGYRTYSELLGRPGGGDWSLQDINSLQVAIGVRSSSGSAPCPCTQVYVKVTCHDLIERSSLDSGAGQEVSDLLNAISKSDSGGGADISAQEATIQKAESGSGVDVRSELLGLLLKADVGAATEKVASRYLALVQIASGVEASHLFKGLILSESGSALEISYIEIIHFSKESADVGSGQDVSYELKGILESDDSGQGAEATLNRAIMAKEYPTGALDLASELKAAITDSETGAGIEASLMALWQQSSDSGSAAEASALIYDFFVNEVGQVAEAVTIVAALVSQDTGLGLDEIFEFFRKRVDSGQGAEVTYLVGMVGRMMKVVTYLQDYHQASVFTVPYHQVKVFTADDR